MDDLYKAAESDDKMILVSWQSNYLSSDQSWLNT